MSGIAGISGNSGYQSWLAQIAQFSSGTSGTATTGSSGVTTNSGTVGAFMPPRPTDGSFGSGQGSDNGPPPGGFGSPFGQLPSGLQALLLSDQESSASNDSASTIDNSVATSTDSTAASTQSPWDQLFSQIDTNGDGEISQAEWDAANTTDSSDQTGGASQIQGSPPLPPFQAFGGDSSQVSATDGATASTGATSSSDPCGASDSSSTASTSSTSSTSGTDSSTSSTDSDSDDDFDSVLESMLNDLQSYITGTNASSSGVSVASDLQQLLQKIDVHLGLATNDVGSTYSTAA